MSNDIISDQQIDTSWQPRPKKEAAAWRVKTANWLSLISLGCFAMGPLLLAYLYLYAWQKGLYPNPSAVPFTFGGPWSRNKELGKGLMLLWDPPIYAFLFSLPSFVVKPSRRAAILIVLSLVFFFFAVSHLGLAED